MLTDAAIKRLKKPPAEQTAPDKYSDKHGLQLHVFANGRMSWVYAYRLDGKQRTLTIGKYPLVSLAEARRKRDEARQQIEQGIDPNHAKQQAKREADGADTFEYVGREWFAKKQHEWVEGNTKRVLMRLENDVYPYLGKQKIAEITAPELLRVVQRVESRSVETAHRVLQYCGQIFRYGMATGRNIHDPSPALRGALTKYKKTNFPTITDPTKIAKLLKSIDLYHGTFVVQSALKLAPMFFVRIGDLRQAKWSEIDLDAAEWRFAVSKTGQDHIVALPTQAVAILRELHQLTGQYEYVFYGARNRHRPMSDRAVNTALQIMGYNTKTEITGHGFRAMARTILHERLGFPPDVIEHQLAHRVPDSLGTAYNRTKFLEQRKVMMQAWADYLEGLRTDSNLIPFSKAASA